MPGADRISLLLLKAFIWKRGWYNSNLEFYPLPILWKCLLLICYKEFVMSSNKSLANVWALNHYFQPDAIKFPNVSSGSCFDCKQQNICPVGFKQLPSTFRLFTSIRENFGITCHMGECEPPNKTLMHQTKTTVLMESSNYLS